jgi:hypothetical protein
MKWRMKVGIEWRPSMAGRPKNGGRPTTFTLQRMASFIACNLSAQPFVSSTHSANANANTYNARYFMLCVVVASVV